MRLAWIAFGGIESEGDTLTSRLASSRYRLLIPARELKALGHESSLVLVDGLEPAAAVYSRIEADILIVAKLLPDQSAKVLPTLRDLLAFAKADCKPIISDICDDHFHLEYYRELPALADTVVTPTPQMAARVRQYADRPCVVIPDPAEGVRMAPHVYRGGSERRELRLLWFGARGNLDALFKSLPQFTHCGIRAELEIVCDGRPDIGAACDEWNRRDGRALWIHSTEWSLGAMQDALEHSDVVVIPADTDNPQKLVKSPNRIVEAIHAGRFVLASPLPAYLEFAPYAWISDDFAAGLRWMLGNPDAALGRVTAGQAHIDAHFSRSAIARLWRETLRGIVPG